MASLIGFLNPFCSEHTTDEAKAVCIPHHHLMCLDCLISRPHQTKDCVIKDISKLETENDKAVVDLVALTQTIARKEEELDTFIDYVDKQSRRIDSEAKVFYEMLKEKLVVRLRKTSEHSKAESEKAKREILDSKVNLDNMKKAIKEKLLKTNVAAERKDMVNILAKLKEVPEKENFESHFCGSHNLLTAVSEDGPLGDIALKFGQHIYECEPVPVTESHQRKHTSPNVSENSDNNNVVKSDHESTNFKDDQGSTSKVEIYAASDTQDEKEYNRTTSSQKSKPLVKPKPAKNSSQKSANDERNSSSEHFMKTDCHENTDETYGLIKNVQNRCFQLSPEDKFQGMSISKLSMPDSDKYIALLNKTQKAVVVVNKKGEYISCVSNGESDEVLELTFAGDNKIAMLLSEKDRIKLRTFLFSEEKLTKWSDHPLKLNRKDVTGLDFDRTKQKFAVTCSDEITIIYKSGTAISNPISKDTKSTVRSDPADESFLTLTRYDFSQKNMFLLRASPSKKTLKCFSRPKNEWVWRKELKETDFDQPRDMQLNDDFVIILCKSTIYRITKSKGELVNPPVTISDLSNDALGMCVKKTENIAIVSSDFENKPTLSFVGL